MEVSITTNTQRHGVNLGIRTFLIDVRVDAIGTVQGNGYERRSESARPLWVGDRILMAARTAVIRARSC